MQRASNRASNLLMISGETSGAVSSGDQDGVCKNRVATRTESTVLMGGEGARPVGGSRRRATENDARAPGWLTGWPPQKSGPLLVRLGGVPPGNRLRQRAMSSYFPYPLLVKSYDRSCRTFVLDLFAAPSPNIASRPFGLIHFPRETC